MGNVPEGERESVSGGVGVAGEGLFAVEVGGDGDEDEFADEGGVDGGGVVAGQTDVRAEFVGPSFGGGGAVGEGGGRGPVGGIGGEGGPAGLEDGPDPVAADVEEVGGGGGVGGEGAGIGEGVVEAQEVGGVG